MTDQSGTVKKTTKEIIEEINRLDKRKAEITKDLSVYFRESVNKKLNRLKELIGDDYEIKRLDTNDMPYLKSTDITAAIKEYKKEVKKTIENKIKENKERFETEKRDIDKKYNDEILDMEEEYKNELSKFSNEKDVLKNEQQKRIKDLLGNHEEEKKRINREHSEEILNIKKKYDEEISMLNDENEASITNLDQQKTKNMNEIRRIHGEKLEEEKRNIELSIKELRNELKQKEEDIIKNNSDVIKKGKDKIRKDFEQFKLDNRNKNEKELKEISNRLETEKNTIRNDNFTKDAKEKIEKLNKSYFTVITNGPSNENIIFPFLSQIVSIFPYYFIFKNRLVQVWNETNIDKIYNIDNITEQAEEYNMKRDKYILELKAELKTSMLGMTYTKTDCTKKEEIQKFINEYNDVYGTIFLKIQDVNKGLELLETNITREMKKKITKLFERLRDIIIIIKTITAKIQDYKIDNTYLNLCYEYLNQFNVDEPEAPETQVDKPQYEGNDNTSDSFISKFINMTDIDDDYFHIHTMYDFVMYGGIDNTKEKIENIMNEQSVKKLEELFIYCN